MIKKCKKCQIEKEINRFNSFNYTYKGITKVHYNNTCKDCLNSYRKEKYKENPEKYREKRRQYRSKGSLAYEKHKLKEKSPERLMRKKELHKQRTFRRLWWNLFKHYPEARKITKISYFDLWKLARKQKLICPLTGRRLTNENISIDHINPVGNGGGHELENLRLVDFNANIARNSLSDNDLIKLCYDIVKHNKLI